MNKNEPNEKVMSIVFHFENGMKFPVATFNRCRLMDVFKIALAKVINNNDTLDLRRAKFHYMGNDITVYFLNNKKVSSLKLPNTFCTIDVYKLGNLK